MRFFPFLFTLGVAFSLVIPRELGEVEKFSYRVEIYRNDILDIWYPVFEREDLNDAVRKTVEGIWSEVKDDLVSNVEGGFRNRTFFSLRFEIKRMDDKVVSVLFDSLAYLGGAHGIPKRVALNYDLREKKILKLSDLFEGEGWKEALNEEVEKKLKGMKLINEFRGLKENPDFYITSWGIVIFFQVYEYTPFAQGFPEIPIPRSFEYMKKDYWR